MSVDKNKFENEKDVARELGVGRVDDFSFIDCASPRTFIFLLIKFHYTFSIFYIVITLFYNKMLLYIILYIITCYYIFI